VEFLRIRVFPIQDFEEVPHYGRAQRGERLAANRNRRTGVLVLIAKFDENEKKGIRFARPRPALMDLNALRASLRVVVRPR
jgi:hypothetical protein